MFWFYLFLAFMAGLILNAGSGYWAGYSKGYQDKSTEDIGREYDSADYF